MGRGRLVRSLQGGGQVVLFMCVILLAACTPIVTPTPVPSGTRTPTPTWTPLPTERDRWPELLQHTPIPWTTPLPPAESTVLDGMYVKDETGEHQWYNCRRCPDYRLVGGIWRLSLDRGVFRIYYPETGWRSLGSFTVEDDRLTLFNDPYCHLEVGVYTWSLEEGQLNLTVVDDPCSTSFRLRAANLTHMPWSACSPPEGVNPESWKAPKGCEDI